jgi:hypothetical protein
MFGDSRVRNLKTRVQRSDRLLVERLEDRCLPSYLGFSAAPVTIAGDSDTEVISSGRSVRGERQALSIRDLAESRAAQISAQEKGQPDRSAPIWHFEAMLISSPRR